LVGNRDYICTHCRSITGRRHAPSAGRGARVARAAARAEPGSWASISPIGADRRSQELRSCGSGNTTTGIPITYCSGAKHHLASRARLGRSDGARDVFIGVKYGFERNPDCRPRIIAPAFGALAAIANRGGVEGRGPCRVHTPLTTKPKGEIVAKGKRIGVTVELQPDGVCSQGGRRAGLAIACDAADCGARGFAAAGCRIRTAINAPEASARLRQTGAGAVRSCVQAHKQKIQGTPATPEGDSPHKQRLGAPCRSKPTTQ